MRKRIMLTYDYYTGDGGKQTLTFTVEVEKRTHGGRTGYYLVLGTMEEVREISIRLVPCD